ASNRGSGQGLEAIVMARLLCVDRPQRLPFANSMHTRRRSPMLFGLSEEPCTHGANQRKNGSPAKHIHVRQKRRLLNQPAVDNAIRPGSGRSRSKAMGKKSRNSG